MTASVNGQTDTQGNSREKTNTHTLDSQMKVTVSNTHTHDSTMKVTVVVRETATGNALGQGRVNTDSLSLSVHTDPPSSCKMQPQTSRYAKSVSNSEISEISQEVVIVQQTDSNDSQSNDSCVDVENIQFLHDNNDDLFLGASANSMCKLQTKEPLAGSLTTGYTAKQKRHTEGRGEGPTEWFKDKVVFEEKIRKRQNQFVEQQIVSMLAQQPITRYRVQPSPTAQ